MPNSRKIDKIRLLHRLRPSRLHKSPAPLEVEVGFHTEIHIHPRLPIPEAIYPVSSSTMSNHTMNPYTTSQPSNGPNEGYIHVTSTHTFDAHIPLRTITSTTTDPDSRTWFLEAARLGMTGTHKYNHAPNPDPSKALADTSIPLPPPPPPPPSHTYGTYAATPTTGPGCADQPTAAGAAAAAPDDDTNRPAEKCVSCGVRQGYQTQVKRVCVNGDRPGLCWPCVNTQLGTWAAAQLWYQS